METLLRDIKHALRMFRESGVSFVVTAVMALGLGIGANTAIFSLVNTVLLKPPPFPNADRIVILGTKSPQGQNNSASPAKFAYWAQQTDVVQDVAAFSDGVMNWTGSELPIQVRAERVSSKYFPLFGVPFIMGRPFNAEEDAPNAAAAVVIGEGLWMRRFGSDRAVVGKTMLLGGEPFTITGVVSQKFDFQDFGPAPEVWVPFQLDPNSPDQGHYFQAAWAVKRRGEPRAGYSALECGDEGIYCQISAGARKGRRLSSNIAAARPGTRVANVYLYFDGRRWIRSIDCVFECGKPPAGARGIEKTRTRHPSRAGRWARANHPAAHDGKPIARLRGRRVRIAPRFRRHPCVAFRKYGWTATSGNRRRIGSS
jgi:hypothetical protein